MTASDRSHEHWDIDVTQKSRGKPPLHYDMKEVKIDCITSANNLFSLQCSENTHTEYFRFKCLGEGSKKCFHMLADFSRLLELLIICFLRQSWGTWPGNEERYTMHSSALWVIIPASKYTPANSNLNFLHNFGLNLQHPFCRYKKHRISVILTVRYYHQQQLLNFRQNYIWSQW